MSDRIAVMNDGRFEQVGPPDEVYDEPETRFVADFLGTANIFDGAVRSVEDGIATVECEDATLRARDSRGVAVGDDVSVVIRPERFELSTATTDGGTAAETDGARIDDNVNVFEGEITFRRHLGSSIEYHLETLEGRELVVVRRSGHDERTAGERVSVRVEADECRIVEA